MRVDGGSNMINADAIRLFLKRKADKAIIGLLQDDDFVPLAWWFYGSLVYNNSMPEGERKELEEALLSIQGEKL